MASGFRAQVKKSFLTELPRRIPPFSASTAELEGHHGLLFEAKVEKRLWLFIYITFAQNWHASTVELAWNRSRYYPFSSMPFALTDERGNYEMNSLREQVFRSRIGNLMGERQGIWWAPEERPSVAQQMKQLKDLVKAGAARKLPGPKARAKLVPVSAIVDDSLDAVCRYVIPCFKEVAKFHGVGAKWIKDE